MLRSREDIVNDIRRELGSDDQTETLIDWLRDMWETHDLIVDTFGETRAVEILSAPSSMRKDFVFS